MGIGLGLRLELGRELRLELGLGLGLASTRPLHHRLREEALKLLIVQRRSPLLHVDCGVRRSASRSGFSLKESALYHDHRRARRGGSSLEDNAPHHDHGRAAHLAWHKVLAAAKTWFRQTCTCAPRAYGCAQAAPTECASAGASAERGLYALLARSPLPPATTRGYLASGCWCSIWIIVRRPPAPLAARCTFEPGVRARGPPSAHWVYLPCAGPIGVTTVSRGMTLVQEPAKADVLEFSGRAAWPNAVLARGTLTCARRPWPISEAPPGTPITPCRVALLRL